MISQKVKIEDHGLIDRLEEYPEIVEAEARTFLETVLAYHLRLVRAFTPVGVTGLLRGSIFTEIKGFTANLRGMVGTQWPYAAPVEEGTKPHWAPIDQLKLWAARKFGDEDIAYAIRGKIKKSGTKGVYMFKRAFAQSQGVIAQQQRLLGERIKKRIEGN